MALAYAAGRWTVDASRRTRYSILLRRGLLGHPLSDLIVRDDARRRLVVIDSRVSDIYGERLRAWLTTIDGDVSVMTVSISEALKERRTVDEIHAAALSAGLARRDELIGIGGGIVADLVGVAAAELRKETAYVLIPTTLVGLIDAGVGAKRAINFHGKKSYLGDYHPARLSLMDPDFLLTLGADELRAGMAEIKKVAEMVDADLFRVLEQHGITLISDNFRGSIGDTTLRLAIDGILRQLADDLWEQELERWPDHGHSISPVLELETQMAHGLAVSICCALGAAIAHGRGMLADDALNRTLSLSLRLGLPIWHPLLDDPAFIQRAVMSTALVRGGQHWPVPAGIGTHEFIEPTIPEITAGARVLRARTEDHTQ